MIAARPIRFTGHLDTHRRILTALGATVVTDAPGWVVYAVGSGRLALHQAPSSDPHTGERSSGDTVLGFETEDLDGAVAAAQAAGVDIRIEQTEHGRAGVVRAADGTTFTIDSMAPAETAAPQDTRLAVMQIWYTTDTATARAVVTGIGARPRITGEDGIWADFRCETGGLAAVHRAGEVGVELAYHYAGDVEALTPVLARAGVTARLIDETYGRTLRIPDPDRDAEIWINEKQADLYGYRAEG